MKKTNRGFDISEFTDDYGLQCSIQKSSSAEDDKIWFGVNDADPMILASRAHKHGVDTTETTGWVKFPVPDDVLMHTRMHLTREMVAELLPTLQKFVETGELT